MVVMMLLSYTVVSLIDLKLSRAEKSKETIALYIVLMSVSCIIGIANGYVSDMPSPSEPIRRFVFMIIGK